MIPVRVLCPYYLGTFRQSNVERPDIDLRKSFASNKKRSWADVCMQVSTAAYKAIEAKRRLVFETSDHCYLIPVLAAVQQHRLPPIQLTWFDSHGCFHSFDTGGPSLSEMALSTMTNWAPQEMMVIAQARPIAEPQVHLVGGFDMTQGERERFDMTEIRLNGQLTKNPRDRFHWIHFDSDIVRQWSQCQFHKGQGLDKSLVKNLLTGIEPDLVSIHLWDAAQDDGTVASQATSFFKELGWYR